MANKTLVVVESPAKAKTINKYLGSKYIVEASVGHIKDLITHRLGVDVKNDFQPKYVTIRGKAEVIKKLNQLAKTANDVLIATDPDREGEAIAWHIAEEIKPNNKNIKRVLFNEITKNGIKKGLDNPLEINEDLFMSQQARRVMDRLIGYQVSPFLSRAMLTKTSKALSAGRVQSVALRLICERESEIQSFVPIDYWSILGDFQDEKKTTIKARLVSFDGKNIKNPDGSAKASNESEQKKLDKEIASLHFIRSESQSKELCDRIKKQSFSIQEINKKQVKRNPSAPFTTSSLQQEASKRLGFSNNKTMQVAQKLYEGVNIGDDGMVGLITYMRTDSVRLSPESQQAAKEFIGKNYGKEYVPDKMPVYSTKSKSVQDAHEAIRPTTLDYTPKAMKKFLDKDSLALYELIYNRFLASQMSPALIDQTTINIKGGDFIFRATGSVIVFKGFLTLYDDMKDDNGGEKESILPDYLKTMQQLKLEQLDIAKSQTKPKPRYTEASLVKELDERGIGRPSTYASIVSTLIDREYVELSKKVFSPTELGSDVNVILIKNFPDLFSVDFTAEMEQELDTVADGEKSYVEVLNNFYNPFHKSLHNAEEHSDIEDIVCEKCGGKMIIRVSRKGRFLGCSNYPDCTNTKPLPKDKTEEKEEPVIAEGIFCDICGKPMLIRQSKFGKFYGCVDYPTCKGTKPIKSGVTCPKCKQGELTEKFSPKSKKKFWGCSNYPNCDYLTNYEPVNQKCPNCNHYYLEMHYKKVENNWEKYLKCPECKTNFEIENK